MKRSYNIIEYIFAVISLFQTSLGVVMKISCTLET